jgi:ribosomal protein S12 methylthiotransferase
MRRPGDQDKTLERIRAWRATCPDLTLRSTFILGFPGESEDDFATLIAFIEEARLDRVGAFKYEPVAGAPANDLGLPHVAPEVMDDRYRRFMHAQQRIGAKNLQKKLGRHLPVIIDAAGARSAEGRTKGDAPEIDGKVNISSRRPLRVGDIVSVKIERADAYDLYGTAV